MIPAPVVEDVLGMFGYRVVWDEIKEHFASCKAYEIVGILGDNTPEFLIQGYKGSNDLTRDVALAQPFISVSVKWDGCCHWNLGDEDGYIHTCDPQDIIKIGELMKYIYNRAYELMEREPEQPWPSKENES